MCNKNWEKRLLYDISILVRPDILFSRLDVTDVVTMSSVYVTYVVYYMCLSPAFSINKYSSINKTYVPVFYRGNEIWVRIRVRMN